VFIYSKKNSEFICYKNKRFGCLEQENPADARVTRDSAIIPRWTSAAILDIIQPEIASFDPTTPKTFA